MTARIPGFLTHPLTRGLSLDDPTTTRLRRQILAEKMFLRRIYQEWYEQIEALLPPGDASVLELGAGASFLNEYMAGTLTSDIIWLPGLDLVADASELPFAPGSLRGIAMTNVFHHLSKPASFLREAARCVVRGGALVMIEPWVSRWSRFVYRRLHHEPFEPEAPEWGFSTSGPLSGANGAQPWIVFARDYSRFVETYPEWHLDHVDVGMPFRYLLSGGMAGRALVPAWTFGMWRAAERALSRYKSALAMFASIRLVRTSHTGQ
ncbi:MAG: class I SAM-dependent methyltransferase [Thermoanaerobaculales bacterium]